MVVALLFLYWLTRLKNTEEDKVSVNQQKNFTSEEDIHQQSALNVKSESTVDIPTHHSENLKTVSGVREVVLFERSADDVKQVSQMPVSASEIASFLDSKGELNPDVEFRNLHDLRFNHDNKIQNLSGLYFDQDADVKFMLIYEDELFSNLSEMSCFRFKKDPVYTYENKQFALRSNNTGYVTVMVEGRWYLRLFIDNVGGLVAGRLFKFTDDKWVFTDNIVVAPRRLKLSDFSKRAELICE